MHRRQFIFTALLALVPLLAGCPSSDGSGKGSGNGAAGGTIKIGVAGPITGPAAAFGEMIQKATLLKIEEINEAGGIKGQKVEALIEDDRGDTTEAANVSRKLASDKSVCLVIGHFNSTCSNAAKEEYNRKGVLQFSPGSTNVQVCQGSPWTFRNLYRDDYQGQLLARYSKETLGAKKVAVFYDNDDYGKGLMESCKAEAEKIGLEMLEPISYVRERTSDFKPLVGKIKDKGVDAIILCGLYGDAATIVKAARNDLDINVPVLGGDGVLNDQFIKNAGKAAEGCLVFTPFLQDLVKDDPKARAFYESFKKKYNKEPDTWAALTYDAVGMALKAVEEVGTDREKIRDWMAGVTTKEKGYVGVTGNTFFDKEGDCYSKGLHVAVVKDGAFVAAEKQVKLD